MEVIRGGRVAGERRGRWHGEAGERKGRGSREAREVGVRDKEKGV